MKKIMVLVIVAIMAFAGYVAAQTSVADVGSRHNLGSLSTHGGGESTNTDQVCVFCHTPHQPTGQTTDPLWNHTLSATANYGVYASSTLNSVPTDIGGGSSTSNLCMSCHDGTVAVNSLYNPPGVGAANPAMNVGDNLSATFQIAAGRTANLGIVLTNDHPVNMLYDDVADTGLNADAAGNSVTFGGNTVPLYTGNVQCSSCHDPHDSQYGSFLRVTMAGSTLCLVCHNK